MSWWNEPVSDKASVVTVEMLRAALYAKLPSTPLVLHPDHLKEWQAWRARNLSTGVASGS